MENRLATKEKEYDETYDKLLRVSAEFENYRKRTAREMDDFRKYAIQSLLKEMLSAVDHIELAIQAAASNSAPDKKLTEGLSLTLKELLRIFGEIQSEAHRGRGEALQPGIPRGDSARGVRGVSGKHRVARNAEGIPDRQPAAAAIARGGGRPR